ncbi:GNAT family N-acetyltransferase [Syntrophomonas wolfei]|uniref:BioF2-like acetyltransferase domain-containing protein n=1 Tax=Syntrophomonas wolfei subsp. wolfei (strain DSM 2245B / Goettingen) TaxID=335541 RepID=Q0AZ15_SYNWW|nr:GNAT family N-acetyltransferase [Syntrophomonas wolfei]ABI68039.1 hypothetical protein Swol_0715 [Syntrophomonas wolfei subsp. wolfei str. Goettingen G311]
MLNIIEASDKNLDKWDELIGNSINGTIFHLEKFLSYHGERFKDRGKFLYICEGTQPFAQISLTIEEQDGECLARSPYGASYGGVVFQSYPGYRKGKEIVQLILDYLKQHQVDRFIITPPIACCSKSSLDTFNFNLLEAGFKSINRDISSVYYFENRPVFECLPSKVRNTIRTAEKNDIEIRQNADIRDFWQVLSSTYFKHGTNPTHSIEEFNLLMDLLPGRIYTNVAYKDGIPVAGVACFEINKLTNSSFYLCQFQEYQKYQALSLLVMTTLESSREKGFSFFDFGTSTVNMQARPNIFTFKEHFTKIGQFRETFEWKRQP